MYEWYSALSLLSTMIVDAVRAAAAKAVEAKFLLPADADRLIAQAAASNVLSPQATASNAVGR